MAREYTKKSQIQFQDDMLENDGTPRTGPDSKRPEVDEEFSIELVKCEVCQEIIGKIELSQFKPPLHGSMFYAKNKKNDYPPPFHPTLSWEDLRCPYCKKRPFYSRNFIINEKGEKCGFTYECHICDQGFKDSQALNGHKRLHIEKE